MFTKFGGKVEHGPGKNPLDFGGNPDHVSLGLELGYTVDVLRHTRLDLVARALHGFCLTVIKRDCWVLAGVCALLFYCVPFWFTLLLLAGQLLQASAKCEGIEDVALSDFCG